MAYQVAERLYVDKAGKVYTEDELTERSEVVLLMTAGGELTDAEAEKYGLVKAARASKAKAVDAAPEDKSVSGPDDTKASGA